MGTNPNPTNLEALRTAECFADLYATWSMESWKEGDENQSTYYSGQASAYRHIVSVLKEK